MSDDQGRAEFEARVLRALEDLRLDTFSNRVLLTDIRSVRPTFSRIAGGVAAGLWLFLISNVAIGMLLVGGCLNRGTPAAFREWLFPAPTSAPSSQPPKPVPSTSSQEMYPWPQPHVP